MTFEEFSNALGSMDPGELALGAGAVGVVLTLMAVFAVLSFFISALGYRKMLQKAGEAGWKAFIPYYASFIRFRLCWATKYFWPMFAGSLFVHFFGKTENVALSIAVIVMSIVALVLQMKLDIRTAKSFGKTTGWGVLFFFFPFIVSLILGYGSAQYIGNTTLSE